MGKQGATVAVSSLVDKGCPKSRVDVVDAAPAK